MSSTTSKGDADHGAAEGGEESLPLHAFDATEWPLLAAVLERSSTARAPPQREHGCVAAEGAVGADVAGAQPPRLAAGPGHTLLASSWPPEEETAPSSLEATVRAAATEVAVLKATRPDDPGVRRAAEAADRAEASVRAAASVDAKAIGADTAKPGRDVAAAVLSLQGVDWEGRVKTAMGKIDVQGREFDEQLQHLREHHALPTAVRKVALEQLLDAVGALAVTAQALVLQAEPEAEWAGRLFSADRLRPELRKLPRAVAAARRWGLEVPRWLLDAGESELRSMPLAAADPKAVGGARGGATLQRVIGALVVSGGAIALKHVAWVDFDEKGEPMFEKADYGFSPISRPPREVLDAPECANLVTALRVYVERATVATAALVPKVLDDVAAYADAKAKALSHPDAKAALYELDTLSRQVPQPFCPPMDNPPAAHDGLKRAMELVKHSDADALPPPTALEHVVFKQQRAVAGSKRLYQLVSEVARGVEGHELVVLPGGVKKLARTVFKSAVNYGCDLSRITDQVRCTVVASTLAGVAVALRGLMGCGAVSVVRVKNRFASDYDATPAGGYLDLQTMVVFESEGGGWAMGEVQINMWSMLRIKENPEGGHKVFNFARAMRAFDEATFKHDGDFDDGVAARIAAGVLLSVELTEKRIGESASAVAALCRALTAGECRVQKLDLEGNAIGSSGAVALASAIKRNTSVSELRLNGNAIGATGAVALADALKRNSSVSTIFLCSNEIGARGAVALADTLKRSTSIFRLHLTWNAIGPSGAVALADALTHNNSVCKFSLSSNNIGDLGAIALANALKRNTSVSELWLNNNAIGSSGAAALADALKSSTAVSALSLSDNQFSASELDDLVQSGRVFLS